MLRLTRETDYALVLLALMVRLGREGIFTARDLAGQTHIPLPMVSKVLKRLGREEILQSSRGVHGGYRLAKDPAALSVAQVILTLEGPISLTECSGHHDTPCAIEQCCPVSGALQKVNRVVVEALEGMTLAQMACPGQASDYRLQATGKAKTPAEMASAELATGH